MKNLGIWVKQLFLNTVISIYKFERIRYKTTNKSYALITCWMDSSLFLRSIPPSKTDFRLAR